MTASEPLTSVVMVTYRTGQVLEQAIASVLASTAPVELVLVNNGNPPDVETRLSELAKNERRLVWLSGHGNVGFGTACNLGAKAAHGEYLLLLNPDCVLQPGTVSQLLSHAQDQQLRRPAMIGARLRDEQGRDQRGCRRALLTPVTACVEALHLHRLFPRLRLNFHEEPLPAAIAPVPAVSGAFMFLSAKDYWSIGGYDEKYFLHVEDLDICLRFRRAGGEIYFAPDVIVTHIGSTSETASAFIERCKAKGFSRYFLKNFSSPLYYPVLAFLLPSIWLRAALKQAFCADRAPEHRENKLLPAQFSANRVYPPETRKPTRK